ncbi:F-box/LRR-repeat protein At5g63520-like isoform X2 [Solanum dulcamara]|uniref:F-box/LRR-repeat protein At5g63520-like isoform X2 n=1 Tax=Solanum dulcamara TaxID=45834 RepID=UPI002485A472|nr:F-box/LRR-repeat protein At5g63520-like isoform X2 [Solanum dulcamara]
MAELRRRAAADMETTIDLIGDDLLHNILSRLPALACANAACVSRSWNLIITTLLSSPNLSSALSLNPSLQDAVNEAFDKVLSRPIRPQFVSASIGPSFSLQQAHQLITGKLGSRIPTVTLVSQGIFGRNAVSDEFEEVQWEFIENDEARLNHGNENWGVLLTVGFLPGLKVSLIPLLSKTQGTQALMIDELVLNIRECSSSVSGFASPVAILLFSETDMKPVLQKLDYAFCPETVIVGEGGSQFLYQGETASNHFNEEEYSSAAVALSFLRDSGNPPDVGETQFHVVLSPGISQIGPTYKAVAVKERPRDYSTWLTAKREEQFENLDGLTMLDQIYDEFGGDLYCSALYVGVSKRRKCSIGMEKGSWIYLREFHEVLRGDEEYLYVHGGGIRSGDSFQFYLANANVARDSCNNASNNLRCLKRDGHTTSDNVNSKKKSVFGCIMFSCCGRGEYFVQPDVDCSPFMENFPGITFSGTFSAAEIARGDLSLYGPVSEENSSLRCCSHVYSTVYLVMSYTPASPSTL